MKSRAELKRENKRMKKELAELRSTIAWLLWQISEPIPLGSIKEVGDGWRECTIET